MLHAIHAWAAAMLHFLTHWIAPGICTLIGVRLLTRWGNAGHRGLGLAAFACGCIAASAIWSLAEAYGW